MSSTPKYAKEKLWSMLEKLEGANELLAARDSFETIAPLVPPGLRNDVERSAKRLKELKQDGLLCYSPTWYQEEFHKQMCKVLLLNKGNQVGGSLCLYVEVARAVRNLDPYGKYPARGVCALLGMGETLIGSTIHRLLFEPGAYSVIRDKKTGEYRTYRPWSRDVEREGVRGDLEREKESEPAQPLIPEHEIEDRIYTDRKSNVFKYVHLKSGWKIIMLNSEGPFTHGEGFEADLVGIDEDLGTPGWFAQMMARTLKRKGKIRWAAVPQDRVPDMSRVIRRAEEEENLPAPSTKLIRVRTYDNPYLDAEEVERTAVELKAQGEEVYQRRMLGVLSGNDLLVYPQWNSYVHSAIHYLSEAEMAQEEAGTQIRAHAQKVFTQNEGRPPDHYCVYAFTDPGFKATVTELVAVPPPEEGDFVVIFDELRMHNATASQWAAALKPKVSGLLLQDHVIDMHGGRITAIGSGVSAVTFFQEALREEDISSVMSGYSFRAANDNKKFRQQALRNKLSKQKDGFPRIFVVLEKCTHFVSEIREYRRKVHRTAAGNSVSEDSDPRQKHDAVDCGEYIAAEELPYVKPVSIRRYTDREWRKRQAYFNGASLGAPPDEDAIYFGAKGA